MDERASVMAKLALWQATGFFIGPGKNLSYNFVCYNTLHMIFYRGIKNYNN